MRLGVVTLHLLFLATMFADLKAANTAWIDYGTALNQTKGFPLVWFFLLIFFLLMVWFLLSVSVTSDFLAFYCLFEIIFSKSLFGFIPWVGLVATQSVIAAFVWETLVFENATFVKFTVDSIAELNYTLSIRTTSFTKFFKGLAWFQALRYCDF